MTRNPAVEGASSRRLEGVDDRVDGRDVEGPGDRAPLVERDRAGADHGPAPRLGRREPGPAVPGDVAARLASGVGELDARDRPLAVDEPGDPGQRLDVSVVPDAEVAGRDAAVAGHGGRLDDHQGRAADGTTPQVDQVPVVRQPLVGAVLAHRRHDDPVAERHPADFQGAEQVDLGHFAVVVDVGHAAVGPPPVRVHLRSAVV